MCNLCPAETQKQQPDTTEMKKVKAYINREGSQNGDVFLSDGGVASFHFASEGMQTTYYQSRIPKELVSESGQIDFDRLWDKLSYGEQYLHDWPEHVDSVTDEMIEDAVNWLGYNMDELEHVGTLEEIGVAIRSNTELD